MKVIRLTTDWCVNKNAIRAFHNYKIKGSGNISYQGVMVYIEPVGDDAQKLPKRFMYIVPIDKFIEAITSSNSFIDLIALSETHKMLQDSRRTRDEQTLVGLLSERHNLD